MQSIRTAEWVRRSVFLLSIGVVGVAQGAFVPVLSGTSPSGANTTFNYTLNFGTNSSPGGPVERFQPGDFITIYDVFGLVSATAPANFNVTTQNVGKTPPAVLPSDSPVVPNVTFTYAGPAMSLDTFFPNALIVSTFADSKVGEFASRDTHNLPPLVGQPVSQIGVVMVPNPGGGVIPEPGSIIGVGALGAIALMRPKR